MLLAVMFLVVAGSITACESPLPAPSPPPLSLPVSNEQFGLAAVVIRESGMTPELSRLARESGAGWDRFPIWWHEVQTVEHQLHPGIYDHLLAQEPLSYVLAVLTSRYPGAVSLDPECVRVVRRAYLEGERPPERYGDGKYGFCVTYAGYTYSYESGKILYREPPLLENGEPNPANPWAVFVYSTTLHYRDRVHAWELFNETEPGFQSGWDPEKGETPFIATYLPPPLVYTALISDAITIIQHTNPGDPIILGSPLSEDAWNLAKGVSQDRGWYSQVLTGLNNTPLSAVGLHAYGEPRLSYEMITRLHNRTPFPFWLTETGLHIGEPDANGNCPSRLPCGNEEEQAAYVVQQAVWALRAFQETGLQGKIFHFSFRDMDQPWGLLQGNEPRAAYDAFKFLVHLLNGATYDSFEKHDRYVRMTFVKPDKRISLLWATKKLETSEPILATVPAAQQGIIATVYNQTGMPIRSMVASQGTFTVELPPPTHPKGTGIDVPSSSGDPNDCMIGGPVLVLVEESGAFAAPIGSASLICRNGRAMGTFLQGYDPDSGLASLTVSCSPTRTYDLSWTRPGVVYAGMVREVPPPGRTCTLTLTDRDGHSISQSLRDTCRDEGDSGSEPGGDHPDDNHSAADAPPIPSGQFFALPEGARHPARVAILQRGAPSDLWWLLAQLGEPADFIGADFDPVATAAQYPVLLIPSGGLYGLEGSAAFRARLEEYARRGGTIIAFAQQHGYEYGALPGGAVGGYGWTEDNSCFAASLYLSQWHPILSGIPRATLDAHVDGYFTSVPTGTQVLLSRTANGMPAAILYPYGSGYVFATTMYDDWGASHGQSSADARTLLRDLLAWAIDDEGEPEGGLLQFAPGTPITLTFTLTNTTFFTATGVALRVVDPARQVVLTATLPVTIDPGQSAVLQHTLPPTTTPGIWRLDTSLLAVNGFRLTAESQTLRFAIARPAEPVDLAPELSLSITAPAERFVLNTGTVFTFTVRNRSPVTQTVELQYWLPHHTWKTGDPSYGEFKAPNRQTLVVPPYGEVHHRWPRVIRRWEDRLWARLMRDGQVVASAHFAVYGTTGAAYVTANLEPSQVQRTGVTTLTVQASPSWWSDAFTATFRIRAMDAAGTIFHTAMLTEPVLLRRPAEPFTSTLAVPASIAAGTGYVWVEAVAPGGRVVGGAFAPFTVPASPLAFSPILLPLEGGSVVSIGLAVANTSPSLLVEQGTVTLTLTLPGQAITPTISTSFPLTPSSSIALSLPLDLPPLTFGTYTLTVKTADEYGQRRAELLWPTIPLVAGRLDQPSYHARDVAYLDLTLVNPGPFLLPLTATLQSAIANLQSAFILSPSVSLTTTWSISIPADVAAGRYPLTLTLALPGGDALTRTLAVVEIPPASLEVFAAPHSLAAGDVLSVTLANTGGADTAVTGTLRVVDARGQTVVSATIHAAPVPAGGHRALSLPLPPQMMGGFYTLRGDLTDSTNGVRRMFVPLEVAGLKAGLSVATDRPEYLTTDGLTLTAVMTSGTHPLEGGTLTWRVIQPAGFLRLLRPKFITYTTANSGLPWDGISAMAADGEGNLWLASAEHIATLRASGEWVRHPSMTELGLEPGWINGLAADKVGNIGVAADGGAAIRLASGEWLTYTTANSGLTSPRVAAVAADSQGNFWFATQPHWDDEQQKWVGGGVSVRLVSGEWLTYTPAISGLTSPNVTDVAVDPQGNVWFATPPWWDEDLQREVGGGVSVHLTSGKWLTYTTANSELPSNRVHTVAVDTDGNVWMAGDWAGLSVLLPDGSWRLYSAGDGLTGDGVTAIAVALDGTRWAAAYPGITAISGPLVGLSPWEVYSGPWEEDGYIFPSAITVDPAGNRWLAATKGGEGGLTYYLYRLAADGTVWETVDPPSGEYLWERNSSLVVDGAGTAWVAGTECGVRARDAAGVWTSYTRESTGGRLPSDIVWDAIIDADGNLWFATSPYWDSEAEGYVGGGIGVRLTDTTWVSYTMENSGLASNIVTRLAADRQGNVWAATQPYLWWGMGEYVGGLSVRLASGEWLTYTTVNSPLPTNRIAALTVDDYDHLWLVTPCFWDEQTGQEVRMRLLSRSPDGAWAIYPLDDFPCASIPSMAVGRDGRVWMVVGNYWWGGPSFLSAYTPDSGELVTYTLSSLSGQAHSFPSDLMMDRMGDLWVAGSSNVFRYTGLERVLWQATVPVGLDGNTSLTETAVLPADWLGATGRMFLEGELRNALGQRLALDRQPFTVYPADVPALSLAISPTIAVPRAPVTLEIGLHNGSSLTLTGQVITLTLGSAYRETVGPLDVPPGTRTTVTAVIPAPRATGTFWVEATDGTRVARDRLTVAGLSLTTTVTAPDVVGREPFDLVVSLTNPGPLDLAVGVTVDSSDTRHGTRNTHSIIPASETRVLSATFAITADTTFTVTLTGDVTRTLVHTVAFGEAVAASFMPDPLYPEGPVAIPYTFTNTGSLPVSFTAVVTAAAQHITRATQMDLYLPVGGATSGVLLLDLPAGAYTLTCATPFETHQIPFRVAPPEAAEFSATIGPREGSIIPVIAVITNTGFHPLSGTLRLDAPFFSADLPVSVPPSVSVSDSLRLDTATAAPGTHTATLTLLNAGGFPLASSVLTFTVPGADLVLTRVPTDTVVRAGEWVTLTFGLANRGSAPATAALTVTVGDLVNEVQSLWLPGGEEGALHFAFRAPDGLAGSGLLCTYEFLGERRDLVLRVAGVDLGVEAGWDALVYVPGLTATLRLTVTNRSAALTPPLYVLVNPPTGPSITQTLALTPGETAVLDFPLPAVDGLVFYGIYEEQEQRGVYLNTTYLRTLNPDVTLVPDRAAYRPGETVHVAVYAAVTGTLAVSAPGFTATLPLTSCPAPPAPCFQFALPYDLPRGTHSIDYVLGGGPTRSALFDVDAPWVRITEARLLDLPYAPGDTVKVDLTVASTDPLTVALRAWMLYPEGARTAPQSVIHHLQPTINNRLSLTLPLSTTQAGPHHLVYLLTHPDDPDLVYAAGSEAFDVGSAVLLSLYTDRTEYADPTAPVTAHALIWAHRSAEGQLALSLDGAAGWDYPVNLITGTHIYTFSLPSPIRPGHHSLRGTFTISGLRGGAGTSFIYGTAAADLVVAPPHLLASAPGLTRTVELVVRNVGGFPAPTTTVHLWDGAAGAGILLAELPVRPLQAGETAYIPFVWDISGQGGLHTLTAVVDSADEVGEWHEENNEAMAEIRLPSFALESMTGQKVWTVGNLLTATVRATNLLSVEVSLRVTATLERAGWPPGQSQTAMLTLAPQAAQMLEFAWNTEGFRGGFYTLRVWGATEEESLQSAVGLWLYSPADFAAEPRTGPAPLRVSFTDLSFVPAPITAWMWDFGDGSPVVTDRHPVHIYTRPGEYTVTLTTTLGFSTFVKSRASYITVLPALPDQYRLYLPLVMNGGGR